LIGIQLRASKQERESALKRPMYYVSQDVQSNVFPHENFLRTPLGTPRAAAPAILSKEKAGRKMNG